MGVQVPLLVLMFRHYIKSKIHRATVTKCDMEYQGSIAIDKKLMIAANINEYEKVQVLDINNGQRFETYAVYGKNGEICINGAAARLAQVGDKVIIITYCMIDEKDKFELVLIFPNEYNIIGKIETKSVANSN